MTAGTPPATTEPAWTARRPSARAAPRGGAGGDTGLWIVLGLMTVYSAIHIGFRLLASWSLGEDDPIENLLVQDLRAIYDAHQPPLYDWVLYAVQSVTGPTIVSFLAIKYAALIGTGAALYAIARRSIGAGISALLAVEALALIYQLSWRFHEGYTHQVGAMLAVAATMWAMLRTLDAPRAANIALFGVASALGTLTQPVFVLFALSLVLAAAAEPDVRRRFGLSALAVAVIPVALSIALVLWLANRDGAGSPFVPTDAVFSFALPGWRLIWGGFLNALRAPLFYLSPLILIVPLMFRGFLRRAWNDVALVTGMASPADDPAAPGLHERIVLRTSLIGFGLSLIVSAALGLKGYSSHVYMPLYLTSVVWIMGAVQRTAPAAVAVSRFGRLALAIAVIALVARLANMFVLDPVCKICRWGIPYPGLVAELSRAGAAGGVIVTPDHELGGNLRAGLPDATIVMPGGRLLQHEDAVRGGRPVIAVWRASLPDQAAQQQLARYLLPGQSISSAKVVRVPWRHLWRPDGYRFSEWKFMPITPGSGSVPANRVP